MQIKPARVLSQRSQTSGFVDTVLAQLRALGDAKNVDRGCKNTFEINDCLVGAAGFELATPCAQGGCAHCYAFAPSAANTHFISSLARMVCPTTPYNPMRIHWVPGDLASHFTSQDNSPSGPRVSGQLRLWTRLARRFGDSKKAERHDGYAVIATALFFLNHLSRLVGRVRHDGLVSVP